MEVLGNLDELRRYRARLETVPGRKLVCGLVPTMGALHEGHLQLVDRCRQLADCVVVSIFVNPTQFGPHEDFDRYPRTLEADLDQCRVRGVDAVFLPEVSDLYPPDVAAVQVEVPALSADLEGLIRPGHFAGVCRVVTKLLCAVAPQVAVFGEKDYQQLCVVRALVEDLLLPVRIEALPTVREPGGLALSSRNRYLDSEQRQQALALYKALQIARVMVEEQGALEPEAVEAAMRKTIQAHQMTVDYAVIRHPRTLARLDVIEPQLTGGVVALVAARLGQVRLIDNCPMALPED